MKKKRIKITVNDETRTYIKVDKGIYRLWGSDELVSYTGRPITKFIK